MTPDTICSLDSLREHLRHFTPGWKVLQADGSTHFKKPSDEIFSYIVGGLLWEQGAWHTWNHVLGY